MANTSRRPQNRGNQQRAGKTKVKTHRRTTQTGRKTTVQRHDRTIQGRGNQPRRSSASKVKRQATPSSAKANLNKAWRQRKRGNDRKALGFGLLALAQILAFLLIQATVLLVIAGVAVLTAVGLVIESVVNDDNRQ